MEAVAENFEVPDRVALSDLGEREFRLLVESSPYAMIMVNYQQKLVMVNRKTEEIFGYSREELLGAPLMMLIPDRFQQRHQAQWKKFTQNREHRPLGNKRDLLGKRKDGTQVPIEIALIPLHMRKGKFIFATIIDITERKRSEEDLRIAVRMRDDFLSIASHELKTPLTSLLMQIQLRKRLLTKDPTVFATDKLSKMLERDEAQVWALNRLIDDMLDLSRMSTGRLSFDPAEMDLSTIARDICTRFSSQCLDSGVSFQVDAAVPVFGLWDRRRIEQMLANLLTNALKYGKKTPIRVSLRLNGEIAELRVQDQGKGIAPQDHERIFNRFERADAAGTSGLGIGLYLVKEIVALHGGSVRVESELGMGATFIVSFPVQLPA